MTPIGTARSKALPVMKVCPISCRSMPMQLHIIYTATAVLLSRKRYASWREIQSEYEDYKTSLGPWSQPEVAEYLAHEHPDLEPGADRQLDAFTSGQQQVCRLTFRSSGG